MPQRRLTAWPLRRYRTAVHTGESAAPVEWTDHNVHDPGVTLLQVVAYTLGVAALAVASVGVFRGRRRSAESTAADAPRLLISSILDKLKALVRPVLRRVLG